MALYSCKLLVMFWKWLGAFLVGNWMRKYENNVRFSCSYRLFFIKNPRVLIVSDWDPLKANICILNVARYMRLLFLSHKKEGNSFFILSKNHLFIIAEKLDSTTLPTRIVSHLTTIQIKLGANDAKTQIKNLVSIKCHFLSNVSTNCWFLFSFSTRL